MNAAPHLAVTIHSWSMVALGAGIAQTQAGPLVGGTSNTAWPSANRALFIPFVIDGPLVVTKLWVGNGSTLNGNFDVGIYDEAGTKLISTGSTAQAGAGVLQVVSVTSTRLSAGQFYLALASSSGTGEFRAVSVPAEWLRTMGVFMQDSAFALPATATPAAMASAYVPLVGLGTKWMV